MAPDFTERLYEFGNPNRSGDGTFTSATEPPTPEDMDAAYNKKLRTAVVAGGAVAAVGLGLVPRMKRFGGPGIMGGWQKSGNRGAVRGNIARQKRFGLKKRKKKPPKQNPNEDVDLQRLIEDIIELNEKIHERHLSLRHKWPNRP